MANGITPCLPNVSMPHVLWPLQGIQTPIYRQETSEGGFTHEVIDHFELTTPGIQSPEEYQETARDIAAFLEYVGEPAKAETQGCWCMGDIVPGVVYLHCLSAKSRILA